MTNAERAARYRANRPDVGAERWRNELARKAASEATRVDSLASMVERVATMETEIEQAKTVAAHRSTEV